MEAAQSVTRSHSTEERSLLGAAPLWWFISMVLIASVSFRIRFGGVTEPIDDAYITLRIVRNLVDGNGIVYNVGEPTLQTTPLYTLLAAAICRLTGLTPVTAGIPIMILADLVSIVLFQYIATVATGRYLLGAFCTLVFMVSKYAALSTMNHMETPLFVMLLLLPCACACAGDTRRLRNIGAVSAGLAALCRPEGALMVVIYLLHCWRRDRRLPVREAVCVAVVVIPWVIFATVYFGSPIPHSATAKRVAFLTKPNEALQALWYAFSYIFYGGRTVQYADAANRTGVLVVSLWAVGAYRLYRDSSPASIMTWYAALYVLSYYIGNPYIFHWYTVPPQPGLILGAVVGGHYLLRSDGDMVSSRRFVFACETLLLAVLSLWILDRYNLTGSSSVQGNASSTGPSRVWPRLTFPHTGNAPVAGLHYEREGHYKLVAEELTPYTSRETTILAPEFGALGYYLPSKIFSSAAHVNPEALPFLPPLAAETEVNHSVPTRMVRGLRTDYVVTLDVFIRRSLLRDPWFLENYRLWKFYPFQYLTNRGIYVFQRNDLQPPPWPTQHLAPQHGE